MTELKKKTGGAPGLSSDEAEASRRIHGENRLPAVRPPSFFKRLMGNLNDPIIRVLLIALTLNVALTFPHCNWLETGGIVLAVSIATLVSTLSEVGSERAFRALDRQEGGQCRVYRDGKLCDLPSEEIVVGDVMLLSGGERIRADARILSGEVTVDQSALSGESAELHKYRAKTEPDPTLSEPGRVYTGSIVCAGEATVKVERVGGETMYGQIAKGLGDEVRDSPLKVRLSRLATQISRIGYVCAALVSLSYLFGAIVLPAHFDPALMLACITNFHTIFPLLLHALTLAITVIVVAVPEGLPMMITVVLSSNMKKMLRDGLLVRKPVGIETAGSMDLLFTDKTGTLTYGDMTLSSIIGGDGTVYRSYRALEAARAFCRTLTVAALDCNEARVGEGMPIGGNATDRALAVFFCGHGEEQAEPISRIPFDSERKYAAVHTARGIFIKGAPDVLLPYVSSYLSGEGEHCPYGGASSCAAERAWHEAASRGERVLLLCAAESIPGDRLPPLTLLGFLVIGDRVRREAAEAVRQLRGAGVQVVMVTGDGEETATSVARKCGLGDIDRAGAVLSASELHAITDEELIARLPYLRVVCRALPVDKARLVRVAQSAGRVVGMTGDGVNDAPSLRSADVGFAMGSGTDLAKEAGDVIILNDDIASIANTVRYGRTIFSSIRKFITFQLTMNLCAVGVSLFGQLIGLGSPITILQMLWVNIIMDTLGGLAFAGEPALDSFMREKPKKRDEPILSPYMLHQVLLTGSVTLLFCMAVLRSQTLLSWFGCTYGSVTHLTVFFAFFIFAGLVNCLNARSERILVFSHLRENKMFLILMFLISCIQMLMIYFGGALFSTAPLTAAQLFSVIGLSLLILPADLVRKCFYKLSGGRR